MKSTHIYPVKKYSFNGKHLSLRSNLKVLLSCFLVLISLYLWVPIKEKEAPQKYSQSNSLHKVEVETALPTLAQKIQSYIIRVNPKVDPQEALTMAEAVIQYGEEFNVDPTLILAVIKVESGYDKYALSNQGAMGLMQVIPKYHYMKITNGYKLGHKNIYEPQTNIRLGAQILRENLDTTKNLIKALLMYNGSLQDNTQEYYHLVLAAKQDVERYLAKA